MTEWSPDEVFGVIRRCEADTDWVLDGLLGPMTSLSGIDTDVLQARRLVGHWLMQLSHQLEALIREEDTGDTDALIPVFADHASHHRAFVADVAYRSNLRRAITHLQAGRITGIRLQAVDPGSRQPSVRSRLRGMIIASGSGSKGVLISHPYLRGSLFDARRHAAQSSAWSQWTDVATRSYTAPDVARRREIAAHIAVTDRRTLLLALAVMLMPSDVVETRSRIMRDLSAVAGSMPSAVFSANGMQYVSAFQVLAAACANEGIPVAVQQHGGHFGLDEVHAVENVEAAAADRFYTYGWTDSRPNIAPLPTAMPAMASSMDRRRLLVMSLEASDVVYRVQPFCIPDHARKCLNATRTFLDELGDDSGYAPAVRSGVREHALIGAAVPRDDSSVTGTVSASASGLVVHNYFGTSWLETLAMNVPTVCIVPPNIHRFREAARPLVDELRRHGIIHDDPRAAARFVRELGGDARAWWLQPDLQSDRARFVSTYANYSDDWLERWRSELTALAD